MPNTTRKYLGHVNRVNLPYDLEHSMGVLGKLSENSAFLPRVPI
jgi:hypothetical protein